LENRSTSNTWVIGRLKPGVSIEEAESNLNVISQQVATEYGTRVDGPSITLTRPGMVGDAVGTPARAFALGVLALSAIVLLTACANLAGVLAARGADRQRELAIRLSIGAGRGRLVRQLLTETLVLACVGGAAGVVASVIAARALSSWRLPIALPVQLDVTPDVRVFAFALLISVLAGIAFGVAPARQAAATNPNTALKAVEGVHAGRWPLRDVLVCVQVALCFVLVAACLTSLRGLQSALRMPLGLNPSRVTMASFDVGLSGYSRDSGENLRRRALEEIIRLPGVEAAAFGNSLPLNIDQSSTGVYLDDRPDLPRSRMPRAIKYQVSPGFFDTLGIRILQGRDIDWRDTSTSRRIVVVNEAFANQIFGERDVLGRRFRYGAQGPPIEVVGVVETGKYQSLTEAEAPAVFEPVLQAYNTTTVILVRSSRKSGEVASDIRRVMHSLDPSLPLFGVRGVEEMLGFVLLPMRVAAVALGAFGVLAVMLAATGIHGVVSYAVARRRREIAIRVAVGATGGSIVQLVLRRIAVLVVLGVLTGFPLAIATGGLLGSIVYQGSVNNASTMLGVLVIVGLVGLAASWLPARRALRLQPATALYLE
jgi:predicted permease